MKLIRFFCFLGLFFHVFSVHCAELDDAIANTRSACSGISDSMNDLKIKAGINTAVTAVGTVSGGVALGAGIEKTKVDLEKESFEEEIAKLMSLHSDAQTEPLVITDKEEFFEQVEVALNSAAGARIADLNKKSKELEEKSKMLGNLRTGTLAVSAATNIAGVAIAATNQVKGNLGDRVKSCVESVKNLSAIYMQARLDKDINTETMTKAGDIIAACSRWENADIKAINNRGTGAAVASGVGATTGVVGTIISAVANTDKTRSGDKKTEKDLNTTANVMSGATTVASATATVFNATQIAAIKKVVSIADKCEGAL